MEYKRLLSLTMTFAMLFGTAAVLPQGVLSESTSITASAEGETSGKCGDNVYWSVENNVLTISGTGDMEDYGYFSRPFAGKGIKSVVIKSGVTSIGEFAFHECYSITSVTIPGSVTSIGEFAFYDCTSLANVNIPKSIINIGSNAFKHCVSLSSISFPSSITSIGDYVFAGCKSLTKVTIPSSVTNIGISAFSSCTNLKSVTIPKSVTSIKAWAFSGTKWLEIQQKKDPLVVVNGILIDASTSEDKVSIPSSVKSVGSGAFSGCTNLTSVTIPKSVTSIGWSAFYECTNLKSVTIPDSVTSIGHDAFYGCTSLTSVTIPSSVKSIDKEAFWRCTNLKSVTIQKGVTSIGSKAFSQCRSLTKVTIPGSVTSIGDEAFSSCSNLTSVTIPGSVKSIGKSAFESCKGLTSVTIQKGVESIGESAFLFCSELKNVSIPSSVTNIGDSAFLSCKSLTSITIPGSVTSIGKEAFSYCSSLKSVTIQNGVTTIGDRMFDGCTNLTSVTIPSSFISIGEHAFYNCFSLTSVTIPDSVTSIGKEAFGHYYYNDSFQFGKIDGFTINGFKGTAAEKYAKDNDFIFAEIELPKAIRIAGANRFATAAEISKASFKTANTVVLAYGLNYADALAGVTLANKLNAPILLTYTAKLPDETQAEIKRLGAKKVIILGGTGAISKDVEDSLKKQGLTTERKAGTTRFGTATAIAEKLNDKPTDVFFVYAFNYADALSVSTVAALKNAPIIYLKTNGELDKDTADYLAKLKKAGSVKNAYVIGGEGVISKDMLNKAGKALGVTPTRVAGKNRYATCTEVNNKFKSVLTGSAVCVAKGLDFPDALAGGVFAAQHKAPLFLADNTLKDEQKTYLKGKKSDAFYVFGGTGAVPDKLVSEITKAS